MPSHCTIECNRPSWLFYSGETVTGRFVLTTTTNKSVTGKYHHVFALFL